jgi:hypothetical protein
MLKHQGKRLAGTRKRTLVMAAMALIVPLTALTSASSAMAEPMGIFKIFNQCPTEIPGLAQCSYAKTTSGEFVIGSTKSPISVPVVLQGGYIPTGNPENEAEYFALPAKNGESISKSEQNVSGGITGLINCEEITGSGLIETFFRNLCKGTLEKGITAVGAVAESVASEKNPSIFNEFNLAREEGTALTLPLRVHLKNSLLGNSCYIGSEKEPLQLHLTTGATKPPAPFKSIHGALGETETKQEFTKEGKRLRMLRISGNSLVDNTWTAPGASGCGEANILGFKITGFLDSFLDAKTKIPNKAGENTAILKGELNAATPEVVIESEKL